MESAYFLFQFFQQLFVLLSPCIFCHCQFYIGILLTGGQDPKVFGRTCWQSQTNALSLQASSTIFFAFGLDFGTIVTVRPFRCSGPHHSMGYQIDLLIFVVTDSKTDFRKTSRNIIFGLLLTYQLSFGWTHHWTNPQLGRLQQPGGNGAFQRPFNDLRIEWPAFLNLACFGMQYFNDNLID